MAEHTQGPWEVIPETRWVVRGSDGECIGRTYEVYGGGTMEANAQLFAAAPDLLEACQSALNRIGDSLTQGSVLPLHVASDMLREAIAKAVS